MFFTEFSLTFVIQNPLARHQFSSDNIQTIKQEQLVECQGSIISYSAIQATSTRRVLMEIFITLLFTCSAKTSVEFDQIPMITSR